MSGNKQAVDVLISGGEATAGPPLGPKLGPLGINVKAVVDRINELTKDFSGMKVPVKIIVDVDTKEFEVKVGIPTISALIAKESGIDKGSSEPGRIYVGNLSFDQIVKISKMVGPKLKLDNLKSVTLQVIGTCVSMGVKIDGKDPKTVTKEVKEGLYDKYFIES